MLAKRDYDPDVHLCQLREIFWALPDLVSALLSGQIVNGTQSTAKMLPGSAFLCPEPEPVLMVWACPEQLGFSLTAYRLLVFGDSIRPCTNGVSLLQRIASAAPLNKPKDKSSAPVLFMSDLEWIPFQKITRGFQ